MTASLRAHPAGPLQRLHPSKAFTYGFTVALAIGTALYLVAFTLYSREESW